MLTMTDVKLCRLQRRQENQRYAYVVKRPESGKYFLGCGYGGPGKPVPYYGEELDTAKIYHTAHGARQAAEKYGGCVGLAEIDGDEVPFRWVGWVKPGGTIQYEK